MKLELKNFMWTIYWVINMSTKLYIFIEGNDDELFVNKVVCGCLLPEMNVRPWKYSQKSNKKINGFIKSINSMCADYIFIADYDEGTSLEDKKEEIKTKIPLIDKDHIVIVKNEIESWYLAGINHEISSENVCTKPLRKIKIPDDTEKIMKEHFDKLIPCCFRGSKIDFMKEILKCFDISLAQKRNDSFKNFVNSFCMGKKCE